MTSWLVIQLADSAFPTGGFAHADELEAHVQPGELDSLERYCVQLLSQQVHSALPIVAAVYDDPGRLAELDAFVRTNHWSPAAARASRAQGRALLDAAARNFGHDVLVAARAQLATPAPGGLDGHLAPMFGFVTRALGVPRDEALASYLHLAVRGALSAAIRLGVCDQAEAQALHHRLQPALDAALARASALRLEDVAQIAPLAELIGARQRPSEPRLLQR